MAKREKRVVLDKAIGTLTPLNTRKLGLSALLASASLVNPRKTRSVTQKSSTVSSLQKLLDPTRIPSLNMLVVAKGSEMNKISSLIQESKTLEISIENALSSNAFDAYKHGVEQIIQKDIIFGRFLGQVWKGYFAKVKEYNPVLISKQSTQLQRDIDQLAIEQEEEQDLKKRITDKIERFTRSNEEITGKIEGSESRIQELKLYIASLNEVDITDAPQTEQYWSRLLSENKKFSTIQKQLLFECKEYRKKEKEYLNKIAILESHGVPVEQIFREDVEESDSEYP